MQHLETRLGFDEPLYTKASFKSSFQVHRTVEKWKKIAQMVTLKKTWDSASSDTDAGDKLEMTLWGISVHMLHV